MKTIVFKQRCNFNGKTYEIGDEIKSVKPGEMSGIIKLNEKGFIQPLTSKELEAIAKGSFFKKEKIEEE